jgi:hypothetical protein
MTCSTAVVREERGLPAALFARKPEKALDSGPTISRLEVSMAHMLNAGKSVVFAFAAHIRMR